MKAGIWLIDALRRTRILARYSELSAFAEHPELTEKTRTQNLTSLLQVLHKHNKFYAPLMQRFTDKEISAYPWIVLGNLPVTDKHFINKHFNSLLSPLRHRPVQQKKTGGSTGEPFYYYVDKEHLSWFWAHIYFFWNRFGGYQPGDPFVTIAGNSLRSAGRGFSEKIYHKLQNNYFVKGDLIGTSVELRASKLEKAVLLYGYPSSIRNMLVVKPELPSMFKNLKAIFTTSEQLTPQTREIIESAFGLPVYDMYGANDGGILTCECSEHNGYHINTLTCHAENIKNEHGMCEILLTNLSSHSFPFVRYRVGDLGVIDNEPCRCGLNWPRVTELKGRTRDLIRLPDGGAVHGSFFNALFFKHREITGYKIEQQSDYSLDIYIHLAENQNFNDTAGVIRETLERSVKVPEIRVSPLPELNATNAKFKLIESHVS